MSGITNKEFAELAQYGQYYLMWASNVQIVLGVKKLRQTIGIGTPQDHAPTPDENDQALHFLRHHLCATLKNEYMGLRSPLTLWTALKKRFEKLKYTIFPQAEQNWARLRFADFKSVAEYNSALHRIVPTSLSVARLSRTRRRSRRCSPPSTLAPCRALVTTGKRHARSMTR
jgi:hypothetical protein